MEIKVNEYQLPEAIQFNFEELKNEIIAKTDVYKHMVYTDNDIKAAKADKAELNKLKKSLNDERISRQKAYMKPFDAFKKQVDEVIAIIDEPVRVIDEQVKAYEAKQKEEKEHAIREKFAEMNTLDWLVFDQIFDTKWLNASVSMSSIESDMGVILAGIETNLKSLKGLDYEFEATEMYKSTLSLASAMTEVTRLKDLAIKKAEMEKAKTETVTPVVEAPVVETVTPIVKAPVIETVETPKEWVDLKVNINEYEFDTLTEWLNEQGIEWRII